MNSTAHFLMIYCSLHGLHVNSVVAMSLMGRTAVESHHLWMP